MEGRRIPRVAFILAALVAVPVLAGLLLSRDDIIVAASAPKAASGMTLFLVTQPSFVQRFSANSAEYEIHYGDRLIYPPAGRGATFPIDGRTGSAFVPYNFFVVGNGEYDVLVRYAGSETRHRVHVEKWVDYVFLHPFERGPHVAVEVALSSATGGRPENRILSVGEIVLSIHYRGADGKSNVPLGQVTAHSRHDKTSTAIEIPRAKFDAGPGYYSFEPLFHNLEARDNLQVTADPTMANRQPPWNWIYLKS